MSTDTTGIKYLKLVEVPSDLQGDLRGDLQGDLRLIHIWEVLTGGMIEKSGGVIGKYVR
mgnify:CR=1 FL=1|tara:strand:+ start:1571 stop:1747 length:177 start_codon:yes stop_codon:yes gene_type:complete